MQQETRFTCPHCGQTVAADATAAGQTALCPSCGKEVTVPAAAPSAGGPRQTPGTAVASLILGIMGVAACTGPLTGIPAIICGHMARGRIAREPQRYTGAGLALAGLIMGYVSLLFAIAWLAILAGMLLPALSAARESARTVSCASNLKQISLGVMMYAADHEDTLPPDLATIWESGYVADGKVFVCPSSFSQPAAGAATLRTGQGCDYDYFGGLLGKLEDVSDPARTILAADRPGNQRRGFNVLFADGHVETVREPVETLYRLAEQRGWTLPVAPE